jgi:hypothetical protein
MCGTNELILKYLISELMAEQPPRKAGIENVPVTVIRDPYFDSIDRRSPPRSSSKDPKDFLRKG